MIQTICKCLSLNSFEDVHVFSLTRECIQGSGVHDASSSDLALSMEAATSSRNIHLEFSVESFNRNYWFRPVISTNACPSIWFDWAKPIIDAEYHHSGCKLNLRSSSTCLSYLERWGSSFPDGKKTNDWPLRSRPAWPGSLVSLVCTLPRTRVEVEVFLVLENETKKFNLALHEDPRLQMRYAFMLPSSRNTPFGITLGKTAEAVPRYDEEDFTSKTRHVPIERVDFPQIQHSQ